MKLKKFKERDNKRIGILVFTILCILLVSGVILYRTFAIFEVRTNQNVINGTVQSMGDLEFAFYKEIDGKDTIVKEVPTRDEGYSLDTSSSYCKDLLNDKQVSNVNWDYENWEVRVRNISTTKTKCYLYFKKIYQEEELHGAVPDLGNGRLVPIQIKEEQPTGITIQNMSESYGGKVVKADITDKWYSYTDKMWANAVILKDGKTDTYKPGDEILESDIESYFVWIPRYSYKLKANESDYDGYQPSEYIESVNTVDDFYKLHLNQAPSNAFDILFEGKNSGVKTGNTKDTYITHPAFASFDSNGFWVGKFETGYNQNSDSSDVSSKNNWSSNGAQRNEEIIEKVLIKPQVYSWRSINVSNAFYTSYDYQRELDSHMMKNTEWGAVAYLTQSKYGRCDENNQNCEEVRINNSEYYITGMVAILAPTCGNTGTKEQCNYYGGSSILNVLDSENIQSYFLIKSQVGSTTGNYSGIYDMAGGAFEVVMGVMQGKNDGSKSPATGPDATENSGFNGLYSYDSNAGSKTDGKPWPSSKYYDLYDYNVSSQEYQRGILGDATKELGPFNRVRYKNSSSYGNSRYVNSYNADMSYFPSAGGPWFERGGSNMDGTDTGLFNFSYYTGKDFHDYSFRIVLTP